MTAQTIKLPTEGTASLQAITKLSKSAVFKVLITIILKLEKIKTSSRKLNFILRIKIKMDSIDSKLDLFQSLKNEDLSEQNDHQNDNEGTSQKSVSESEDIKFESRSPAHSDDENNQEPGTSYDKEVKKKVEKQNRKEVEEEEREKML